MKKTKQNKTYTESEPWRLPDTAPPLPPHWLALVPPALSEAASPAGCRGSVSPSTSHQSGWRASEPLLLPLRLSPLKLQRPCSSAIAPNRVVKVQRDSTVTPETRSPLFRMEAICVPIAIAQCGKRWTSSLFPVECALLKPSVKSLLACKIVSIFCECPLIKSSLSPRVGWTFL